MKVANKKEENLHIFWTIYDNIKSHKKQGFTFSLKNTFLEKAQGRERGSYWTPAFWRLTLRKTWTRIRIFTDPHILLAYILRSATENDWLT